MSKSRQKTRATTTPASILPASHALVFLAMCVAGGLAVPVLSLMLIARGATVETLPISIGITLAVTCAFEVPSGVISDVLGRRATFVASMLFHAGAYLFLLVGAGFATVVVSSVLRGFALAAIAKAARRPSDVRLVLAFSISAGVAMVALETYWQLDLLALMGDSWEWVLGVVSCLDMAMASVGSACAMRFGGLAEEIFRGQGRRALYIVLHVSILVVLGALAFVTSAAMFVGLYALMYLLLGARSVSEQTLLHNATSSKERSGMASVQSVAIRGGGVLSSAVGSALVPLVCLSGVWMALAAVAAGIAAPALFSSRIGMRR